jgi:ComF family protein
MNSALESLVELLVPARCAACSRALDVDKPFCEVCRQSVVALGEACPRCAQPGAPRLCAECRRAPPAFASATAPHQYGGQLAVALLRLKYARAGHLARPLGALLAPALRRLRDDRPGILVVAVPLHPRRLRQRGYNQSALLAGEALGESPASGLLERVRPTAGQAGLDRAQRRRNLRGAFRADPRVGGREVLIIDDVLTTGATAGACAEALLAAGARAVHVLVLARAGTP